MDYNGARIKDSYLSLLEGISEEKRESLFEEAKKAYPQLAEVLIEQFREADSKDPERRNKVIGATFMFLALVNSNIVEPVVETRPIKALNAGTSMPTFGRLKPMGR